MHIQRLPNQGISTPANLPARAQKQPDSPKDGFQPGTPSPSPKPGQFGKIARSTAYGAVAALAVGAASNVSPILGAVVGGVAGAAAGFALGLKVGDLVVSGAPEHGPGTTGGYGSLIVGLGTAMLCGAAGLAGGATLPFFSSPMAAGATLGAATLAGRLTLENL